MGNAATTLSVVVVAVIFLGYGFHATVKVLRQSRVRERSHEARFLSEAAEVVSVADPEAEVVSVADPEAEVVSVADPAAEVASEMAAFFGDQSLTAPPHTA